MSTKSEKIESSFKVTMSEAIQINPIKPSPSRLDQRLKLREVFLIVEIIVLDLKTWNVELNF